MEYKIFKEKCRNGPALHNFIFNILCILIPNIKLVGKMAGAEVGADDFC